MILRLFGLGVLTLTLFFAVIFTLPFFIWPFGWYAPTGWLLFLVFFGLGVYLLSQNRKMGQLIFGLTLLFSGLAFLSHNLWDFNLLQFWPALLILWGLALILQRRSTQ